MPIAPEPYKLKCKKCNHSKVVKIKSDALTPMDMLAMSTTCPKCKGDMAKIKMGILDNFFSI